MSGFNPMQLMGMMGGNMGGGNPMMGMLMQMMQGGNPQQMIMQMAQQNPQLKQMLPLIQGKNPQQLEEVFNNLCKEKGISPDEFKRNAMQQFQQMQGK